MCSPTNCGMPQFDLAMKARPGLASVICTERVEQVGSADAAIGAHRERLLPADRRRPPAGRRAEAPSWCGRRCRSSRSRCRACRRRSRPCAAARISSAADIVSIQQTSAPPAFSPRACSAKAATASSSVIAPSGTKSSPVGPIEPATTTGRPAASATARASSAPALLISKTRSFGLVQLQPRRVGAERVGEDDVGAGLDERAVEAGDRLRPLDVPEVRRIAGGEPRREEVGAGRAVGEEHAVGGEKLLERCHDAKTFAALR